MNNQLKLFHLAQEASKKAYAPYSKFNVGAAVLSQNGNFYQGCNVENISYPVGTCAEESAISAMICNGEQQIAEILIFADSAQLITPCGACRQRISEFANNTTKIHLANSSGIQKTMTIDELLPASFKEF